MSNKMAPTLKISNGFEALLNMEENEEPRPLSRLNEKKKARRVKNKGDAMERYLHYPSR